MADLFRPESAEAVAAVVAECAEARRTLEIVGHGSRRGLGAPVEAAATLDLSGVSGVTVYEPNELVLTARAGTPLAEIEALLASERQQLAFEPPDFAALWGGAPGAGTVGGMFSAGLGGPRRAITGGPRDHLLGVRAVNGFGEPFAAGGRVVKNVTGFDLPKLMAGAYGTLGVLTEVTLKVLPAPEASATLCFAGLEDRAGLAALRQAMAGPIPITGAAYLPAEAARRTPGMESAQGAFTCLRLEGPAVVIAAAIDRLCVALAPGAASQAVLEAEPSRRLWRAIAGAEAFAGSAAPVWRISVPPARAAELGEALRRSGLGPLYYDWAGGLVWAEGADDETGGGAAVRRALLDAAGEGHATLIRGSAALRARTAAFQPQSAGVARLAQRLKAQFDPLGLFNPGRMEVPAA